MFSRVGSSAILDRPAPRFHPSDFRVKSLDGVADELADLHADLEPITISTMPGWAASGISGDPANHRAPTTDAAAAARAGQRAPGARLRPAGLALVAVRLHINSVPIAAAAPATIAVPTGSAAPRGQGPTDITYWPAAIANGSSCAPARASADRHRRRAGRPARTISMPTAPSSSAGARLVILAANGIGTARLMLLSRSPAAPSHRARQLPSGLVGRNLMFHPCAMISGFFDDGLAPTWQARSPTSC